MSFPIQYIRRRIAAKLIFMVGLTLFVIIFAWVHFNIAHQRQKLMEHILHTADRHTDTIKLGARAAMMQNSRVDINRIINNIARQPEFESIRIYNKAGRIKFSNRPEEVDRSTNTKGEACHICHRNNPPLMQVDLPGRTRILHASGGYRVLGIITPIENEPGCANSSCHVHSPEKKFLGVLEVGISLKQTDMEISHAENRDRGLAAVVFFVTAAIISFFIMKIIHRPAQRLIEETHRINDGQYAVGMGIAQADEMGQLARAIHHMGGEIAKQQAELNQQRDAYQRLFEMVPCLITVVDRQFRILNYNEVFGQEFAPLPGDYCFCAYKGRNEKCVPCPVEKAFSTGKARSATETGTEKNGKEKLWITWVTPIKNEQGDIIAAMVISLDISDRKRLEVALDQSEKKYHAIFNNIPNPVFVLEMNTLGILDCNKSVKAVYGYTESELIGTPFPNLFPARDRADFSRAVRASGVLDQAKHHHKSGRTLIVNLRISPSEYQGQRVFLVTSSDITQRLEVEQQLIQAGKLATLGEMATGIAHELNQPLSVIKTASSFCIGKIQREEPIAPDLLTNLLTKMDNNVDRATRIITHMRQFARKSEMTLELVQINDVIKDAVDIFSQQLKVRGISLTSETDPDVPKIHADPNRLEQVFINLLVNARDAIEEKWTVPGPIKNDNRITITTRVTNASITASVRDTGAGIPADILNKIFDPFFTTKAVGKGTGLGLSISYGIVKECGGEITARSSAAGGACFALSFPIPGDRGNARSLP